MRDLLIVLGAVVLVILSSAWWPAIGQRCADTWTLYTWHRQLAADRRKWTEPHQGRDRAPENARPLTVVAPDSLQTGHIDADDAWADHLHAINQLGKFGDLTRPAKDLTHYEVEAVIRDLGVPEWVPERWRVAA